MFFLSIPIPDFIPSDRSVKTFVDFIGFSPVRKNKIFCFSFAYSKNSLNGGTPYCAKNFTLRFCQTPSVVRKTEPDTRSRSNGLPAFYKLQFILPSRTQAYKRSYRPGNSRYSIPEGVPGSYTNRFRMSIASPGLISSF